jgi:hypothetical protein
MQPALKILEDWFGKLLGDQNATNIMSFTVDLGEIAQKTCLKGDRKITEPLATSRCDAR